MHLKEGEQHVDDVSSALKRFLRDLPDGLFTRAQRLAWLEASGGPCSLCSVLLTSVFGSPSGPSCTWTRHVPADRRRPVFLSYFSFLVSLCTATVPWG